MSKFGKSGLALWIALILVSLIALTNNWIDVYTEVEFIQKAAADSFSYLKIANSAPLLPDYVEHYHHSQRFLLPYLTGLIAKLIGLDLQTAFRVLTVAVAVAIAYIIARFSSEIGGNSTISFVLTAFVVFNPYAVRIFFSYSIQTIDPAFALFLAAASGFAVFHRWSQVALLIFLAGFFRQTVLLVLPIFALWIGTDFLVRPASRTLQNCLALLFLLFAPLVVYWLTGSIAATFSGPSINSATMTGLITWTQNSFSIGEFGVFLLRGALPFFPLTAFLLGIWLKNRQVFAGVNIETNFLLLICAAVCAQPLLGGPAVTMGSFSRLTCLALPVLALYAACILKKIQIEGTGLLWYGITIAAVVVSSWHHIFTYNGALNSDKAGMFTLLTIGASVVLLICGWQILTNAKVQPETL